MKKAVDNLTGILHLLDAVQDYAVDEMCLNSTDVFGLGDEE